MPQPLVSMRSATPEQRSAFFTSAFRVKGALDDTEFFLRARKAHIADPTEIALINAHIGDVQSELAKVKAEIDAAHAEQFQLRPPTDEEVQRMADLTRQVDALIVTSNTAQQAITLVTSLVTEFRKTRP